MNLKKIKVIKPLCMPKKNIHKELKNKRVK